jgi:hypothetical protein
MQKFSFIYENYIKYILGTQGKKMKKKKMEEIGKFS